MSPCLGCVNFLDGCTSCIPTYYISVSWTCEPCKANCSVCTDGTDCS